MLGERLLAELTAADLADWRNKLIDPEGDADAIRRNRDTANRMLGIAKAAFNLAFHNGRVTDDRAWRRVRAFKGAGEARRIILSETELQRLIDACGPGLRELVVIGALTGARLGELTAARVRDFDADAAILMVSGKTGPRPIHLPAAAVVLLRQIGSGKHPQDHLLTTATGRRWAKSSHLHPFAIAVAGAGLDTGTTYYALRHTWISRALVAGVPTRGVAVHAGTSVVMIERFYSKFVPSDQQHYAALAAPTLRIDGKQKVVPLRPGAAR